MVNKPGELVSVAVDLGHTWMRNESGHKKIIDKCFSIVGVKKEWVVVSGISDMFVLSE